MIEVKASGYCALGEICYKEKEFEEACSNHKKAREIYIDNKKNERLGYVYWRMGRCKSGILQYDTAIEYYQLSQHYSLLHKDFETQKACLYSLANSYKKSNKIDLALETIDKFLSICDEKQDYQSYIFAQGIKATCYEVKKDYDKVIEIYKAIILRISDEKNIFLGYAYNNLGRAYAAKNDFKESIKCFEIAEKIIRKMDKSLLSHTIIEKAEVLFKQKLIDEAAKVLQLGLKYAKDYKDLEYLLKGNYLLADIYDKACDNKNLEEVYHEIIELLKRTEDYDKLRKIYVKLALIHLKQTSIDLCKNDLLLSNNLN